MSDTVTRLTYGENETKREYVLVGTAHVSSASIEEVGTVIGAERPDTVGVEIDAGRFKSLSEPQNWAKLDIVQVLREKKGFLLMANLALSTFQKRIGQDLETKPGQEMLAAYEVAQEVGATPVFIDREVQVTLRRAWRKSSFLGKNKLLALLFGSVFNDEKVEADKIEDLKKKNELEGMMDEFAKELPTVKQVLIDERDQYLATSLFQTTGQKVVAVVGAGHVPGMVKWLNELHGGQARADLAEISAVPPPSLWSRVWPYLIPLAFFSILVAGFVTQGWEAFQHILFTVAITTSSFAAVGGILALAHPVTILLAIVTAPLAAFFHPLVHVAYFTGPSEAFLRKPRVSDLERLSEDAMTFTGYYKNRLLRILLVVLLTTIGATVGMYATLPLILKGLFGA
jgi:pheromone shutdown-related protein TraB